MQEKVFIVTFCEYDICMQDRVFASTRKLEEELAKAIKTYHLYDEENDEPYTVDSLFAAGLIDVREVHIEE